MSVARAVRVAAKVAAGELQEGDDGVEEGAEVKVDGEYSRMRATMHEQDGRANEKLTGEPLPHQEEVIQKYDHPDLLSDADDVLDVVDDLLDALEEARADLLKRVEAESNVADIIENVFPVSLGLVNKVLAKHFTRVDVGGEVFQALIRKAQEFVAEDDDIAASMTQLKVLFLPLGKFEQILHRQRMIDAGELDPEAEAEEQKEGQGRRRGRRGSAASSRRGSVGSSRRGSVGSSAPSASSAASTAAGRGRGRGRERGRGRGRGRGGGNPGRERQGEGESRAQQAGRRGRELSLSGRGGARR